MVIRSNGCFACKRRRIKCDQARPSCKRCQIHRTPCPGYPSESANPFNIVVYGSPTSSSQSDNSRRHALIPLQIDSAAQTRMQLIASTGKGYTPLGDMPAVPLDLMDISRFNTVSIRQPALDSAVYALALAQLGVTSKNTDLLIHAQREYGRSLRLLSSYVARSNSSKVWDEQAASAIIVLKFCEFFEPLHSPQPVSIHYSGLTSFYLSRGPIPLRDHAESILFTLARNVIIGGSLFERRKCFLEEPEWVAISLTAPGRDIFFDLHDIAVRLPGLAELVDTRVKREDKTSKRDVLVQLKRFVHDLDDFAARSWPMPLDTMSPTLSHDTHAWLSVEQTLGYAYQFRSWRSANMYCTWALICLVTSLEFQRLLLPDSQNGPIFQDMQQQVQVEAFIVRNLENLCRGIPSQVGTPPHSVGSVCSLHMLVLASEQFELRGRVVEAKWCRNTLERFKNNGFC